MFSYIVYISYENILIFHSRGLKIKSYVNQTWWATYNLSNKGFNYFYEN